MIRFDQCRSGPTGRVIGHSGLYTGVDVAVLLEVPALHVKFRFTDPRTDSHETNAKARHERCCIKYLFQFFASQFVELLHVVCTFMRSTNNFLVKLLYVMSSSVKIPCLLPARCESSWIEGRLRAVRYDAHMPWLVTVIVRTKPRPSP